LPQEAAAFFRHKINIEEKIDGASVGMMLCNNHPLIRNRDHILRKGYVKRTAAKQQFASVWTWFYEHLDLFKALQDFGPYSVYGEWCVARHGIAYTRLPSWFIAYDLYDYDAGLWVSPVKARMWLAGLGFVVPKLYHQGDYAYKEEELSSWAEAVSDWTDGMPGEGIYLKAYDDKQVLHRFKKVRPGFVRGAFWDQKVIIRNEVSPVKLARCS